MKKIKLTNRAEEIFNKIPQEYAEIIVSSLIAKSVSTGGLFEEVALYLSSEEMKDFIEDFKEEVNFKITAKVVRERKEEIDMVRKNKTKKEERIEKAEDAFTL